LNSPDADFIVVGSGAGGGTVAARLAEEGFTVLLLEAGGDPRTLAGSNPQTPGVNTLPDDYDVPAFHALSTENDGIKWDFFVRHYADSARQKQDSKYVGQLDGTSRDGVLYPRAGTLGGCTAHNALILVYPHDTDWNELADLTGDPSWHADHMRGYFERLENCHHRPAERQLHVTTGHNPSGHGWAGWLDTEVPAPLTAIGDPHLRTAVLDAAVAALRDLGLTPSQADRRARFESEADPNDQRVIADSASGLRYTPLTTKNHQRVGARERVLDVSRRYPDRLKVQLHALATRVLFEDASGEPKRAIGVEYLSGERLYGADAHPSAGEGEIRRVYAAREVILAGGAFNTPQLLMLSGIGPRATLERCKIPVKIDLPGVGQNLQDRYEVAVLNRMSFPSWSTLDGATFRPGDAPHRAWVRDRSGVYGSNGAMLSVVLRSGPTAPVPDLFLYAVIAPFKGYFPTYSTLPAKNLNCLTWIVLKAHTNNTAGEVTLHSGDPRVPPDITFRYFDESNDATGDDLKAVVRGIRVARALASRLKAQSLIVAEEVPGDARQSDAELAEFVRNEAWGHHASCTCRIGARENGGVLSSDFKVHGTEGLRVVDASVFPRIPGFFIVSAVYMIGEKAADVIAATARGTTPPVPPVPSPYQRGRS
jgi:choline dehydrogenase-like flavoprotein